jgi:uncharacterized repeat protein (TIGR01451 family)
MISAVTASVFVFTSIVAAQSVSTTATSTAMASTTATSTTMSTSTATSTTATSTTATSTVATTTPNPNAGLQITNNANTATPHEGDTVTFTIFVSALGPSTSTNIVATDTLPTGLTFVGASASQGSYASSTGTWTVGDLSPGTSATLTIRATVNSGTANQTITNTATVSESPSLVNTSSAVSSTVSIMIAPTATIPTSTTPTSTTPTSTPPTSTSTRPAVVIPQVLSINPNGNFLARGMVVTSVASGSFQGQIWGITYTVNWNDRLPQFIFRTGASATSTNPSEQLATGDVLGVSGRVSEQAPLTVNAMVVRDYSISGFRPPHIMTSTTTSTVSNTTTTNNLSGVFSALQAQINNIAVQLQNLRNIFGRSR